MKISIVQMNVINDRTRNLEQAQLLAQGAIDVDRPDLLAFPEMMSFMGGTIKDRLDNRESLRDGPSYQFLQNLAKEHKIFVHGGSFYEIAGDMAFNTTVVFNRQGQEHAVYRKIHLFDVTTPDGKSYRESETVCPGSEVVSYEAEGLRIGCTICYDLRFGELYLRLAAKGCDVIMVPAAFTLMTGKDHWEPLLRARAIETQCYIAAPAQCGSFPDDQGQPRHCWGHAMMIDPWGHVIAMASDGVGHATAVVDRAYQSKIRSAIPVATHRVLDSGASQLAKAQGAGRVAAD